MKILGNNTSHKTSAALEWGRNHEPIALELYKQNKMATNSDIVISKFGLWISPEYPFLGASPDAAIYDPSEKKPYGFVEIKCPHKHKNNYYQWLVRILIFVVNLLLLMVNSK